MQGFLYSLFVLIYVFYLPGFLLAKTCCKSTGFLSASALGLGLSAVLLPISSFAIALLLGTTVQSNLALAIATSINLFCLIAISRKRNKICTY